MKFKKGRKYKVVKNDHNPNCEGCILKYKGLDMTGCIQKIGGCSIFKMMIDIPNKVRLIEKQDMITFCKKLRKERNNDT